MLLHFIHLYFNKWLGNRAPLSSISLNIMTDCTLLKYRIHLDLDNAFMTAVKREIVSSDSKMVCCLFSLFSH